MADQTYVIPSRGPSSDWFIGAGASSGSAPVRRQPGYIEITTDDDATNVSGVHTQLSYNTMYGGAMHELGSAAANAIPSREYTTAEHGGSSTVVARTDTVLLSDDWTTGTLTLPAAEDIPLGHRITFCDAHGRLNLIAGRSLTIAANGSDVVNGAASVSTTRTHCAIVVHMVAKPVEGVAVGRWVIDPNLL